MSTGWETRQLGDFADVAYGYTAKASHECVGPKFLRITDLTEDGVDWDSVPTCPIESDDFEKHQLQRDDIVFARTGATTGKSFLLQDTPDAVAASYLIRLRLKEPRVLAPFVALFFQTKAYWDTITQGIAGAAQGGFNASKLKDLYIPLPPLPEQKRIVAILDEAFAAIAQAKENAERNLANAKELFESYLNRVFTEKGEGWEEKTLGEISQINSGGTPLKSTKEFWVGGDLPWYSSGELNDLFTKESKKCITRAGLDGSNAKLMPKGALLMGMYDTAALKMSILDREGTFNQAVAGMLPVPTMDYEFLLYAVRHVRPEVLKLRRGVRQKNLSLAKIKAINVTFPKSVDEQSKIASQIATIKAEINCLELLGQQKIAALDELKQSLLQKAFTGQLTSKSPELELVS